MHSPIFLGEQVLLVIHIICGVFSDVSEHDRELFNKLLENVNSLKGERPTSLFMFASIAKKL